MALETFFAYVCFSLCTELTILKKNGQCTLMKCSLAKLVYSVQPCMAKVRVVAYTVSVK